MFAAITAIRCVVRRVKIVSGFALAIAVNALTSRQLLAANRDRVGPPIFIAYDVEPVFEVAALPLLRCDGHGLLPKIASRWIDRICREKSPCPSRSHDTTESCGYAGPPSFFLPICLFSELEGSSRHARRGRRPRAALAFIPKSCRIRRPAIVKFRAHAFSRSTDAAMSSITCPYGASLRAG